MKSYKEGKNFTLTLFSLMFKKHLTVLHNGLWFKSWKLGVRGRMWRENMYVITQSAVLLEKENPDDSI